MFKKVYVEINNCCNLNCSFCIHNSRQKKFMSKDEFEIILNKLKGYTEYLYFHVLGEPLLHPLINEFIDLASKHYKINITTNGYLINKIKDNKNIRQINISLHSFDKNGNISLNEYLESIFKIVDELKDTTIINYRLWNDLDSSIINILNKKYNKKIDKSMKLENNVFIDIKDPFIWPNLCNDLYSDKGKCYGLITHFGILVDGTVVPCCLDSKGDINLGNIFNDTISDILSSNRCRSIINGFKDGYRCEELCKHCGFYIK